MYPQTFHPKTPPATMASLGHRLRNLHGRLGLWLLVSALLGLSVIPQPASAQTYSQAPACWFTQGAATTVTFNVPATLTLTPGMSPGQPIGSPITASPANPFTLDCNSPLPSAGLANNIAGPPTGSDTTLFPTGIPGISYYILPPGSSAGLPAYPQTLTTAPATSGLFTLQLVYTGPYPSNGRTLSGSLSQWQVAICDSPVTKGNTNTQGSGQYKGCDGTPSPQTVISFSLSPVNFVSPTCTVTTDARDKSVTLPSISRSDFNGQDSTAGNQPFTLNLTGCPSNLNVSITLDASNAFSGANGVIAPTAGAYAQGVGVQVLKADATTPVSFGTAFSTGITSGASYDIHLNARYYQTGSSAGSGLVKATATYTLTYQ